MNNADATAGLSTSPDPPQDRSGKSVPPRIETVLAILHILLAYGRHLSLTLEYRAEAWGFSVFARFFGTGRLPVIRARLARGILRIMALQRVLLSRARRGRDVDFSRPRERSAPKPKPPVPPTAEGQAAPPPRQKRVRRSYADTTPDLDNLPTLAELETEIRRRSVGAAIADICRDLGISPSLCYMPFWNALWPVMTWTNGSLPKLWKDLARREREFEPEISSKPPFQIPEQSREGVRRMLGFFIGEQWPIMPDPMLAPRRLSLAAHPP